MVWEDLTPRQILTPGAFRNAAASVLAVSGSINCVKHLQATAVEAGVDVDLFSLFNELGEKVPVLSAVAPTARTRSTRSKRPAAHRALLKQLEPLLDLDALTVTGRTLRDNLDGVVVNNRGRHPSTRPTVLPQRIDRRASRVAGTRERHRQARLAATRPGRALRRVRRSSTTMCRRRSAAMQKGELKPGNVLVLRGCGPKGGPAMAGSASRVVFAIYAAGLENDVAFVSDGQLSGLVQQRHDRRRGVAGVGGRRTARPRRERRSHPHRSRRAHARSRCSRAPSSTRGAPGAATCRFPSSRVSFDLSAKRAADVHGRCAHHTGTEAGLTWLFTGANGMPQPGGITRCLPRLLRESCRRHAHIGHNRVGHLPSWPVSTCSGNGAAEPGQNAGPPDQPAVTVRGQTYTPRSILSRNMGTDEDQTTAFPPHKVVGNIYYVGTRTLSSYLITTPAGHILLNSTYERNVRTIEKSVAGLGFKFADIRILLGTHAHGDHQEGDALVKELTGAQVMAMREDVPALEAIKPGGKAHPIDRTLRDGDEVTLGGTTLVAHLTAGHTRGCTTWTMKAQEGGKDRERRVRVQLSLPRERDARDRERVQQDVQSRARSPVRCAPRRSPGAIQHGGQVCASEGGAPNPFIDPGQLLGRGRDPGGDVPGATRDAAGREALTARTRRSSSISQRGR